MPARSILVEGQLFGIVIRVDSDTITFSRGVFNSSPQCAESPRKHEWKNVVREACSLHLYPLCLNVCLYKQELFV